MAADVATGTATSKVADVETAADAVAEVLEAGADEVAEAASEADADKGDWSYDELPI